MNAQSLPLVSVALATFNGEAYLDRQLDSLLTQDYPRIEIVISDDCSTDRTWEILQSYADKDNRIHLLPRDINRGYVKNFIRTFMECKGDLISPCDQDDIWYPQKIRKLVNEIGDLDLAYCNSRYIDAQGNSMEILYSDQHRMFSGTDSRQLLFATSICGHATIFKKSEILPVIIKAPSAPYIDWAIAFVAANKKGVRYVNEVLVDWRQHSSSYTAHGKTPNSKDRKRIIDDEFINLEVFSKIPSHHEEFNKKAKKLYEKWLNSFFCPSMYCFVLLHGDITHALHPSKHPSLKYLLGQKLKKLIWPNYFE